MLPVPVYLLPVICYGSSYLSRGRVPDSMSFVHCPLSPNTLTFTRDTQTHKPKLKRILFDSIDSIHAFFLIGLSTLARVRASESGPFLHVQVFIVHSRVVSLYLFYFRLYLCVLRGGSPFSYCIVRLSFRRLVQALSLSLSLLLHSPPSALNRFDAAGDWSLFSSFFLSPLPRPFFLFLPLPTYPYTLSLPLLTHLTLFTHRPLAPPSR